MRTCQECGREVPHEHTTVCDVDGLHLCKKCFQPHADGGELHKQDTEAVEVHDVRAEKPARADLVKWAMSQGMDAQAAEKWIDDGLAAGFITAREQA